MNPDKQRIAIAEACGWKEIVKEMYGPLFGRPSSAPLRTQIPNHLRDLNAMHEAEKILTRKQFLKYYELLPGDWPEDAVASTAAQRAEAFLRTLNKWEDSS